MKVMIIRCKMGEPVFCIYQNKGVDQLCSDRAADQHLCFLHIYGTTPLFPESEISSLEPFSVLKISGFNLLMYKLNIVLRRRQRQTLNAISQ